LRYNAEKHGSTIPPEMAEIAKAVELSNQDPLRLAQSKLATDRLEEALRLFDLELAKQAETQRLLAEGYAGRGRVLAQRNQLKDALGEADRSLAIQFNLSAILLRCAMLRRLRRLEEALATCTEATSKISL
jgi:tetratricopeptide (TPR) repeat protein